ncbi:MAG: hypothetical protein ACLRM8_10180 [Alistipes sp.]
MSLRRIITALAATGHARPVPGSRALRALQRLPRIITALLLFLAGIPAHAQPRTGIVYWDLDHLYDTVPALFYNDTDYTPSGRLAWDTERYRRKIRHTAAVIDSMRMPLVALWGVENEAVVRDIAAACEGDYSYLHRTLNSLDGMDFALLYYGDLFEPLYDEPGRRYLYIEAPCASRPAHPPHNRPPGPPVAHRHRGTGVVQRHAHGRMGRPRPARRAPRGEAARRGTHLVARPRSLRAARRTGAPGTARAGQRPPPGRLADARPHSGRHGAPHLGGRCLCAPLSD